MTQIRPRVPAVLLPEPKPVGSDGRYCVIHPKNWHAAFYNAIGIRYLNAPFSRLLGIPQPMANKIYAVSDLDRYVAECDALGGPGDPRAIEAMSGFTLRYTTAVDTSLDPFSAAYFAQQLALYSEISGRKLDQETGELQPIDPAAHAAAANPYRTNDIKFMAKHVRVIVNVLAAANLPPAARILDLGCGWGLSSEVMAFCGAKIDALDINPLFVDLVNRRAPPRNYDIRAQIGAFDTFQAQGPYDLILFYECLHHAVKPWTLIARLKPLLGASGKIAFAGEPINTIWWPHWGIRLDHFSVYCIRKLGWFESGWSLDFLSQCFTRAGYELSTYPGIGLENGRIGFASLPNLAPAAKPTPEAAGSYDEKYALLQEAYENLYNATTLRIVRKLRDALRFRA